MLSGSSTEAPATSGTDWRTERRIERHRVWGQHRTCTHPDPYKGVCGDRRCPRPLQNPALCCYSVALRTWPGHGVFPTPDPKLGAVSEPCWWLTAEEKDGLPHYLWDVANERTVDVEAEGLTSPSYTAISHTWGRWRENDLPPAVIKGVDWPVPRNRLFRVEDLPRILKNVPREGNYVWFDLLCIPQRRHDPIVRLLARPRFSAQQAGQ